MKIYSKASTDVVAHIANMQEAHHPDLDGVTVDALFVFDDEESSEPVLKHQGYSAAAVVKITSVRDRTLGTADAVMTFDRATWLSLTPAQRDALVDHELQHLQWVTDKEGHPKSDSRGRPKLAMRPHDHQFGWFDEIASRHEEASVEVRQARALLETGRQLYFDFAWTKRSEPTQATVTPVMEQTVTLTGSWPRSPVFPQGEEQGETA